MIALLHHVSSVVAAPELVSVSGDDSGVAGAIHTLTCTVILPSGVELSQPPSIQWLGLDTSPPVGPVNQTDYVYISRVNVSLSPASTVYTCIASYTLNGVSSQTVEDSIDINVISELIWYILPCFSYNLLYHMQHSQLQRCQ